MTSDAQAPLVEGHIATGDKGLKADALGFMSNLVIGVASTAPAYSLAATLGFIVVTQGVGVHAPAVLLVSFVPILFVSFGYRYLNKADPDAGTTFAWTTRAFGPWVGWMNGWAIFIADVIVMASLSVIAAQYTYLLFNWNYAYNSTALIIVGAVVWIALMTWICYRGIELSAETQVFLLSAEIAILAAFSIVAFVKTYNGTALPGSMHVSWSWFNPFDLSFSSLIAGVLLGIFIYWGWDSGVAVNEESRDSAEAPGKAAVLSTILLVLIYLVVAMSAQAFAGTKFLGANPNDVLKPLGQGVFGSPWYKLLIIAVLTSASASTQTTILPTARTTLSMAKWRRDSGRVREDSPALSDADPLDARHGSALGRVDGFPAPGRHERERPQRLGHGARLRGLLLLRLHRPRLRLVLQAGALQERDAGSCSPGWCR